MEVKVNIKNEIAAGAVREKLFKEDFVVKPSEWKVHSFAYKAPRGEKTLVELDVHVKNEQGLMKVVNTTFNFSVSNVQKVLNLLGDKEAFDVSHSLLSGAPVETMTLDDVSCKYPYVKVVSMEYKKPIEVSRTATLAFDLEIDGVVYPYSQIIKFAKSEYKTTFDSLRPDMFEVNVAISPAGQFVVQEIINKTGSDKIKVYDAQILGLNPTRTMDVMLYISGNSKNKNIVVKSNPIAASQSFESLIDQVVRFETNLPNSPRMLKPEDLLKNKPEWLHVERIKWLNSEDVASNLGRYEVELHVASETFVKEAVVTFGHGNDYVFMESLGEQHIVIDDAYLFSPAEEIPAEAALLVHTETLPKEGLEDLQIESIKFVGNKINRTNKIVQYNITMIVGGIKKVFRKNLSFKFSLNEAAIKEFSETTSFVTKLPTAITSNENILKVSRQFLDDESLKKIDVFSKLKNKDIKELELVPSALMIKVVGINILRFDTKTRGNVQVEIEFNVKGEDKSMFKIQPIVTRIAEDVALEAIGPTEIHLHDQTILDGIRPKYLVKDQFRVPSGVELINVEIILDDENLNKLDVKFTVQINENIKVIDKTYTFKEADEAIIVETPEELQDNQAYLDTIDLSSMSVFVEIDKQPPYKITPSMFAGLPDDVKVIVKYKWPKVGTSHVDLEVSLAKGNARKLLAIPLDFEVPLSKEALKEYKKTRKDEKKGSVNG